MNMQSYSRFEVRPASVFQLQRPIKIFINVACFFFWICEACFLKVSPHTLTEYDSLRCRTFPLVLFILLLSFISSAIQMLSRGYS